MPTPYQMHIVHAFPTYFPKIYFNIILHLQLGLPSDLLRSDFHVKILYAFLISATRATYPTHLILLDLITRITFGAAYKL
jgi:hypothetical protein